MEDDVEALLELTEYLYPDPVDQFEDLLAELLGVHRHPTIPYKVWRIVRVRAIEAAGESADALVARVDRLLAE